MKKFKPIKTKCQWFASIDEGRQLELVEVDNVGNIKGSSCEPLLSFFKNDSEELYLELYTDKGAVQISIKEIHEAIALAEKDCNSEKWYEENVYSKFKHEEKK